MTKTVHTITKTPNGVGGVLATMRLMGKLVRRYKTDPNIFRLARQITANIPQKDYEGEAAAVLKFVQNKIRYVKDVRGVETVQTPLKTLEYQCGDCDDKTLLFCALMESLGHHCRFTVTGQSQKSFCHIYPEVLLSGKGWLPAETTERWELGEIRIQLPAKRKFDY